MPVTIKTNSGGGSVTLDAGTGSSDTTLTLPNTSGTILQSGTAVTAAQGGTGLTSPGANGNVLTSNGTIWTSATPASPVPTPSAVGQIPFSTNGSTYTATQKIVQGTAVASTSGTSIDFTSIPSWVKRVTVIFNGVSTSGTSFGLVQVGTSSGVTTSGYTGSTAFSGGSSTGANPTTGFGFGNNSASFTFSGSMFIVNVSGNIWVANYSGGSTNTGIACMGGGNVTLSAVLDRVRITTVNGTDTFDAGSVNILYE